MTTIALALLSGFLTTQQAPTLSVLCQASTTDKPPTLTIECALLHKDPKTGTLTVVKAAESPALEVKDRIPVEGLAAVWCAGIEAAMSFPPGVPT